MILIRKLLLHHVSLNFLVLILGACGGDLDHTSSTNAFLEEAHNVSGATHWGVANGNGVWFQGKQVHSDRDIFDGANVSVSLNGQGDWLVGNGNGVWLNGDQVFSDRDIFDGADTSIALPRG